MKNSSLFMLLFFLLLFSACDDSTEGTSVNLDLKFKGEFNSQPLVMLGQSYAYTDGSELNLQLFQFYLSDVTLIKNDKNQNDETLISEIELVSFGEQYTEDAAREGVTLSIGDVPVGNYDGIKFGIGVSSDLNATQPGDYPIGHPLEGHYWSWARGYVFSKIEGTADLDGDGTFEEKLTFHIGENEQYRTLTIDQSIEVKQGAQLDFTVDLYRVLVDLQGEFLNFKETPIDHTNNMDVAAFISDNLPAAIEIK